MREPKITDSVLVYGLLFRYGEPCAGIVVESRTDFILVRVFHPTSHLLDQTIKLSSHELWKLEHDDRYWKWP